MAQIFERTGILFWTGLVALVVWFATAIPGVMDFLRELLAPAAVAPLFVGMLAQSRNEKKKDGTRTSTFKLVVDWKDWLGLSVFVLVLYAITKNADPIVLIRAIERLVKAGTG